MSTPKCDSCDSKCVVPGCAPKNVPVLSSEEITARTVSRDLPMASREVQIFVPPVELDPANLAVDQVEAYNKYRDSTTMGTKVSVDPRAVSEDFIRMVKMYKPRTTVDTTMMDIPEDYRIMYTELLTKYFAPVFENVPASPARGPGFQVFRIDRVVDFTRDEATGAVLWTTIDNQFRFNMWSLTGMKEFILIDQPALNFDGASIGFYTSDLSEHVRMTQVGMPSGLIAWRCEHFVRNSLRMRMYLTEIVF